MKQPIQSNVVGTSKNNLIETFSKLTCSVGPINVDPPSPPPEYDKIFGVSISHKEGQISELRDTLNSVLGQVI